MKRQKIIIDPAVKHTFIGVAVGGIAIFIAMLICAFILTLKDFDVGVASTLSNLCISVGAAFAGFITTYLHKSKGLILGAAAGITLFIIVSIIALFINGGDISFNTLLRLIIMPILSAAGGVFGVNISAKRKMI